MFRSIYTTSLPINLSIKPANTKDPLVSAAAPDVVLPEAQLPKVILLLLRLQHMMTTPSPTHATKMCLHI